MRIGYFSNLRLPSERAYGHQVAGVCSALVQLGHEVHIYAPYRENPIKEDFWHYHGVSRNAQLTYLGSFDPIGKWWLPGVIGLMVLNLRFCHALREELRKIRLDFLYTRTPALLPVLLRSGIPVILELHRLPRFLKKQFVYRCSRCALVVCLTSLMRDELVRWGVDPTRVIVEGDAVDLGSFENLPSKEEAKKAIGIRKYGNTGVRVIGYTGQLESMGLSKGLPVFFAALELLLVRLRSPSPTVRPCSPSTTNNTNEFHVLIAGGPLKIQKKLEHSLSPALHQKVTFLGFQKHCDIPPILAACDVLVYPAPRSDKPFYQRDTSPLKIFEYMAARKPIVTADLSPIREILDEETAFFCAPGNVEALANALQFVLEHPDSVREKVEHAYERVKNHTWEKRMERILSAYKQRA